ncbi:MerR family transcriptional regulator [Pseudomonas sp. PDM13]|uniref:MerR family transcriptional regulator n=1 Tax=Pseudomonas sp. PDM13 TaxID=2769255 RepID=UPI0021E0B00E|nr:MerR family transcriptional regulator [Pseudomonas sp. PDM13]MCU9949360.1 MerR family transcriptional regulator [Pseudomonas sp. PDM13]
MTETAVASQAVIAMQQEELFPIREVSRLTGVNPVTLRAWERRYGLIQPTRTDSGHRLYSFADIEAVRSILAWIDRGVAVSKVGKILARSAQAKAPVAPAYQGVATTEWVELQVQLRRALAAFDEDAMERLYGQVFSTYPLPVVFQDVLMPVWRDLLLRHDEYGVASEWAFLDSFMRARALQRLQLARNRADDRVLLAPIPGECRELELLVAGLLMGSEQVAVSVLGHGQPLQELALVCEKMRPQALVLFSNHPPQDDAATRLSRLALTLDCPLALAGEAADLLVDSLDGSAVACLGSDGRSMQRRLAQFLAGHLDT